MRIQCPVVRRARYLVAAFILIVMAAIFLPGRSFSQEEPATSRIKKPLIYQVGNVVHIHAEGPRPLLLALDALQEKYGWVVDYEDPQYPAGSDAATNPPSPPRRHSNVRRARGESFSMEFNSAPDGFPDEDSVLTAVVNAYNEGSAVAQFELRREKEQGGHFEVVGVGVGQHGEESSQQPIFDLPVTLTTERRSAEQTIVLICEKVSEQSKIPLTPSGIAGNDRGRATVAVGGIGVPARTLLARALASMGGHLSWRLLYDSTGKSYELNVAGLSQ